MTNPRPADGLITFINAEQIAAKGLELEVEGKLAGGLRGTLAIPCKTRRSNRANRP